MKINILVGARFNAALALDVWLNNKLDCRVYTSSPKGKWKLSEGNQFKYRFIPLPFRVLFQVLNRKLGIHLKYYDLIMFDYFASLFMRRADVLHGWASFSLISGMKQKKRGGVFILERACPHVDFQDELLSDESLKLGIEYSGMLSATKIRMRQEYELADYIIVPSIYTLNTFISRGVGIEKLHLQRLDAGFTPKNSKTAKKHPKGQNEKFIVSSIGGNSLRKGFIYLVRAWKELSLDNAELRIKCSMSEIRRIPELYKIINETNSIKVIGYLESLDSFYEETDVFCLPSIDDGFGMVVLEAMVFQCPVIVSQNVGAGDIVKNDHSGFIVESRNSIEISEKIKYLYSNRDVCYSMSLNARHDYDIYQSSGLSLNNSMMDLHKKINLKLDSQH